MLGLIDGMRSPDGLQDGAVREHAAGMLRQEHQQLELLRRQPDLLVAAADRVPVAIDDEIAAHDRAGARRRRFDPPQRHADARQQLLGAERLRHVVVGAGVERADLVGLRAARREHDDRRRAAVSQQPAHLDAVHVGQAQVQDDEIGIDPLDAFQAGLRRTSPWTPHSRASAAAAPSWPESTARRPRSARVTAWLRRVRRRAPRTAAGTTIVNCAPPSGTFSHQMRPPSAASSPRVIARPRPVPVACLRLLDRDRTARRGDPDPTASSPGP